jgi:hypothetical protein
MVNCLGHNLSRKNHNTTLNSASAENKSNYQAFNFWTKHRIGRNRDTHSFKPTFVQLPEPKSVSGTNKDEIENLGSSSSPSPSRSTSPTQLTRPFLKGIETNSVLIDVTDVKDPLVLQDAFHAFNDGSEEYEAYLGR